MDKVCNICLEEDSDLEELGEKNIISIIDYKLGKLYQKWYFVSCQA